MKEDIPYFSSFKAPINNTQPYKDITLIDVYKAITGTHFLSQTKKLRTISEINENRKYKGTHFPYVTFSGIFTKRKEVELVQHSGLLAIDFDHVVDVEGLKLKLLNDLAFQTELLFVSPNGNGLKWVIWIGDYLSTFSHEELALRIYRYIEETYSVKVDEKCKDVGRPAFLCYDPTAFIHPKYLVK